MFEMSDEEFANLAAPPAVTEPENEEVEQENENEEPDHQEESEQETTDEQDQEVPEDSEDGEDESEVQDAFSGSENQEVETEEQDSVESTENKQTSNETVDYKALYEEVIAPFKANGKMIEVKTPEEAKQLMQMGANYTRKMQDIAPYRKQLLMLENAGITNEEQLGYLIDLNNKNPQAIQKLVKDSGIDPLDIDVEGEAAYQVGNHHVVTDQEVAFRTVLDEVRTTDSGQEAIQVINSWDQASKQMLWDNPDAISLIHQQMDNGIFAQIAGEIERQRVLGNIPVTTPFLQAYTQVGDMLRDAGQLQPRPQVTQPLGTKVAAPKRKVANSDQASAAAQSRSTTKKAKQLINPLAMSDEDFLKQMADRL